MASVKILYTGGAILQAYPLKLEDATAYAEGLPAETATKLQLF